MCISAHVALHWNHGWTAGTPFDEIEDLVLYDFGVHWFDFIASLTGRRRNRSSPRVPCQRQANKVPLMAQALVRLDGGQASLVFDGGAPHGPRDTTYVAGTAGSLQADGPDLGAQTVTLTTAMGSRGPHWKANGSTTGSAARWGSFCAPSRRREPSNGARENLFSLALAFAAVRSRIEGKEVEVGAARRLES
jgi:predicted dehydrogenase